MLDSISLVQLGQSRAAAVCSRLFADLGARVSVMRLDSARDGTETADEPLFDQYLDYGKQPLDDAPGSRTMLDRLRDADLVVLSDTPARLAALGLTPAQLCEHGLRAAVVYITPFGLTGPQADDPACDLTLTCASGIAKVLTGQVDDLAEPPVRAVGEQSAFIGGLAGACAGMHLLLIDGYSREDAPMMRSGATPLRYLDVSIHEALATLDIQRLTRAGLGLGAQSRKRLTDGNGATVTILPCSDGYVAISPREPHQWRLWLEVMGQPDWGAEARFAKKSDRVEHFDALHALMSNWSRMRSKHVIADAAQTAHVPCFVLGTPAEQLRSPQLRARGFFEPMTLGGSDYLAPGLPFGLSLVKSAEPAARPVRQRATSASALPLAGVRVLDFSWVIAGPTTTRYLAAFGAEVIKVEAPGRGDPGRSSELHTVLGRAKRAITLDLKTPAGLEVARALVRKSDVLIENFATGVMDRLGLDEPTLRAIKPDLIYLSASGLGRTGPEATAVAYGTLLQCYAGFAALNGHPERAPRVGMAWLDPMCALKLAFIVAACVWRRDRDGSASRVDFSMVEAMLWTMAAPLLQSQCGVEPRARGNRSASCAPHSVYRAVGEDAWIAIAVREPSEWHALCALVPELTPMRALDTKSRLARAHDIDAILARWCAADTPTRLHERLRAAGIPASPVMSAADLLASAHLHARGFWQRTADAAESTEAYLPGFPWCGSVTHRQGPAPALGADNEWAALELLDLDAGEYRRLCEQGAFGNSN